MPYASAEEQRRYQRVWAQQRRAKWFEGKSCQNCGAQDHTLLVVVSGVDKRLPKLWSRSKKSFESILHDYKAYVLCRSCETRQTHAGVVPSTKPLRPGKRRRQTVPASVPRHLQWEWLRWHDLACPMPVHDPPTMEHHRPARHTEETKRKISEGVRKQREKNKVIQVDFTVKKVAS